MKKLRFSEEQIERLKEICESREEIEIDGMTSLGRAFLVKGRIAFDNNCKPAISPESIAIEFGEKFDDVTKHDVFAVYKLNIEKSLGETLIINSIKAKDGEVYCVGKEDMEGLLELADAQREENSKLTEETPIVRYDIVSAKLFDLVGHPVCIYDGDGESKGVLVEMERADVFGNSLITLADGKSWHGIAIDGEAVLKELNEKNEWEVTAKNEQLDHSVCAAVNRKNCKIDVQSFDL